MKPSSLCPSIQEQGRAGTDSGVEASVSRGLPGPLMATPYPLIHESHHHWFHRTVYKSKASFPPCHPLPEVPGRKALCHSPPPACVSRVITESSLRQEIFAPKAMAPTASGQELNPFPKQQPLLTPSTPGQGLRAQLSGIPSTTCLTGLVTCPSSQPSAIGSVPDTEVSNSFFNLPPQTRFC